MAKQTGRIPTGSTIAYTHQRYTIVVIRKFFLATLCLLASCNEPYCVNTNPVFDKAAIDGPEYNRELLKVLEQQDSDAVRYWVNRYIAINNKHYMEANVHGKDLCTKMVFEIGSVKRLEHFITIAGESYSGAELKGVTYRVDSAGGSVHFAMTGLTRIID